MDVGIFEKSRRLRIARISLLLVSPDMLSPENLTFEASRVRFPASYGRMQLVRGGLWSCPPGLVLIAQLLRSSVPAVLDGNRLRAQNVSPCDLFPALNKISN